MVENLGSVTFNQKNEYLKIHCYNQGVATVIAFQNKWLKDWGWNIEKFCCESVENDGVTKDVLQLASCGSYAWDMCVELFFADTANEFEGTQYQRSGLSKYFTALNAFPNI